MKTMKTTAGIVIYRRCLLGTKVLLVFNGRSWSIPRSRLLVAESTAEAAVRVLKEEAQMDAPANLAFVGSVKKGKCETMTCFAAEMVEGKPHATGALKKVKFVDVEEAQKLVKPYQLPVLRFLVNSSLFRRAA